MPASGRLDRPEHLLGRRLGREQAAVPDPEMQHDRIPELLLHRGIGGQGVVGDPVLDYVDDALNQCACVPRQHQYQRVQAR
jgi:hypothetical protein